MYVQVEHCFKEIVKSYTYKTVLAINIEQNLVLSMNKS